MDDEFRRLPAWQGDAGGAGDRAGQQSLEGRFRCRAQAPVVQPFRKVLAFPVMAVV